MLQGLLSDSRGHTTRLLLGDQDKGIAINVRDSTGETALHNSSQYCRPNIKQLLLAAGAGPHLQDEDGSTPLDLAREDGREDHIRLPEVSKTCPVIMTNFIHVIFIFVLLYLCPLPFLLCIHTFLQAALAEPERVCLLHRARSINDAHFATHEAIKEAIGKTRRETKRMCIAAAPSYLEGRVKRGEKLPQVEAMRKKDEEQQKGKKKDNGREEEKPAAAVTLGNRRCEYRDDEEEGKEEGKEVVRAAVFEHVVMEGRLPKELFYDLANMVMMR